MVAKMRGGKQRAKKKPANAGQRRGSGAGAKKKRVTAAKLTFRKREKVDDAFIIEVTMQTLKQVYEQSVGIELREEHVLEWTDAGDYTGIIELGGKPIGYYSYLEHVPNRWYIGALVLAPNVQGQGIGKQIFAHIEREAREQGIGTLEAHVQSENRDALGFWTKQGFEVVGEPKHGSHLIRKTL